MPATQLIFDIETIRDTDLAQRCGYEPKKADDFAPHLYHLPCAIAVGYITEGVLTQVESLHGLLGATDPCSLTEAFWEQASHAPVLISFNGRGFDLPVLELCALRYGCHTGNHFTDAHGTRYRYGKAHLDLMDVLSNYGGATRGLKLSNLVQLLGYHGKDALDGSQVQAFYDAGRLEEIAAYNRRDVIRTYALWLAWARIAGRLTPAGYHEALAASNPWLERIRSGGTGHES